MVPGANGTRPRVPVTDLATHGRLKSDFSSEVPAVGLVPVDFQHLSPEVRNYPGASPAFAVRAMGRLSGPWTNRRVQMKEQAVAPP